MDILIFLDLYSVDGFSRILNQEDSNTDCHYEEFGDREKYNLKIFGVLSDLSVFKGNTEIFTVKLKYCISIKIWKYALKGLGKLDVWLKGLGKDGRILMEYKIITIKEYPTFRFHV